MQIFGRRMPLLAAASAGAVLCAAVGCIVWIGMVVVPNSMRAKSPGRTARKAQRAGGSTTRTATAPGRTGVRWPRLPDGVRAALLNSNGRVVADAASGNRKVDAGAYRIRFRSVDRRWERRSGAVTLAAGGTFAPTVPPAIIADYHLWQGKRKYAAGREREAEAAWLAALRARPELVEARVQLAAALAVHYRYKEARQQIDAALRYAPRDPRAKRLDAVLDRLESKR